MEIEGVTMKVLFPGKFNPIHVGHILQIAKLVKNYDITVGVQCNRTFKRVITYEEVKFILDTIFDKKVIVYKYNKSYISGFPKKIKDNFDMVASGNIKIILSAYRQDIKVIQLNRIKGYRASKMKRMYENGKN